DGANVTINGSVGTNAKLRFNGGPTVNGNVEFNGSGSGWQTVPSGATYNVVYNSTDVTFPTVESLASQEFSGGLSWLASNNDNSLANPPITGNAISISGGANETLVGKAGGANYYLTSLVCSGSSQVIFDNSAGPITIWFGPSGGTGSFTFNGGTAAVKMSQNPADPVKINIAASSSINFNGNNELDALVYDINNAAQGSVTMNGSPEVYGSLITQAFKLNGGPTVNYIPNLTPGSQIDYYGFVDSWNEVNPL
ncbi:MAG TPA: hypothetical protein VGS41_19275, partial [Chthonomonadales bacterium]|nr:hypothetical protein [Chthonomonadales bacterium]